MQGYTTRECCWESQGRPALSTWSRKRWPTDDLPTGFDYGRHWWMWPEFPGSIAAHGYEGQYVIVVPDRELTIVHLGKTPAEHRRHVVGPIADLIRSVPPST